MIPWTAAHQASLSFAIPRSLLKLMYIELVMPSNHLILCRPLLLPSIFPSIRVFSNESPLCIRWKKDQSFSFSISPPSEYSGLISFRMDQSGLGRIKICNFHLEEVSKSALRASSHCLSLSFSSGASLVTWWERIHVLTQETRVRSLVQEDPTGFGAPQSMRHT